MFRLGATFLQLVHLPSLSVGSLLCLSHLIRLCSVLLLSLTLLIYCPSSTRCDYIPRGPYYYGQTLSLNIDKRIKSVNFTVMADWGGSEDAPYTTRAQRSIAAQLNSQHVEYNTQFVVSPGDHFYKGGVSEADSHRFQDTWANVYNDSLPWYLIAGNHDHLGEVSAQVNYSRTSSRFLLPDAYYRVLQHWDRKNLTMEWFFIDTQVFKYHAYEDAPGNLTRHPDPFLRYWLPKSTADWVFIVSHFPLLSVGSHGANNRLKFVKKLADEYGVAAVFHGHDHSCQAFKRNETWYFVAGGGSTCDDKRHSDPDQESVLSNKFLYDSSTHHARFHVKKEKDRKLDKPMKVPCGCYLQMEILDKRTAHAVFKDTQGIELYRTVVKNNKNRIVSKSSPVKNTYMRDPVPYPQLPKSDSEMIGVEDSEVEEMIDEVLIYGILALLFILLTAIRLFRWRWNLMH